MSVFKVASLCLAALSAAAGAQVPSAIHTPVQAELLSRVTARGVTTGDTVYARVAEDWSGGGCRLRRGAILAGSVYKLPKAPHANLSLAFDRAECGGPGLKPFPLILEAIAAPADPLQGELTIHLPAPSEPASENISIRPAAQRIDPPIMFRPGEVRELKGLKLSVGTGPDHSTVLSNPAVDVQLDIHTRLLLVLTGPGAISLSDATPSPDPPNNPAPITPVSEVVENLDSCAPPACDPPAISESEQESYAGNIPLRAFGYAARANMEILGPSTDEALAWLGPNQLLITFNAHPLVPRHGFATADCPVRVIRALLVDIKTHTIRRKLDWRLTDRRQYLWILPRNRILAHIGEELRVYGAGLQIEKRMHLSGPLAFARTSPDGRFIVVGVVRERHTADLHERLTAILGDEPEEDVDVLLMNERFEPVASVMASSQRQPPILLNEGQVGVMVAPGEQKRASKRYSLQLRTWENVTRSLAGFQSSCAPEVSSVAPDLLFVVTCSRVNGAKDYRVLRPDGALLLHAESMLREFGHAASAGAPDTFAVRIFRADSPVLPGEAFTAGELQSADLMVYRQDGKRLLNLRVKCPAASSAGYAVSPAGEVAVLTQEEVDLYDMPRGDR